MADVSAAEATEYGVFGVGNCLLDLSCEVSQEVLDQYSLKPANAILTDPKEPTKYDGLFKKLMESPNVKYIPGGATINTVRVANWMLQGAKKCSACGILGNDENGEAYKKGCKDEGIVAKFYEQSERGTGRCAVCIVDADRSMVADLQCNDIFPQQDPDFLFGNAKDLWQNARICYISGFWNTVNPEGMQKLAKYCSESSDRMFVTNISAPFIAQFFVENVKKLFPYTDILFGNESEAEALAASLNIPINGENGKYDIAKCAAEFAKVVDPDNRGARVIITQGGDPVVVARNNGADPVLYDMPALAKEDIVDFNGAGDAFAGGFMAGILMGKDEATCVKYGAYSAQYIIKRSGTQFADEPVYPDA